MPMSSKFLTESTGEKIVKIGQYLAKIWTKYDSLVLLGHPVHVVQSFSLCMCVYISVSSVRYFMCLLHVIVFETNVFTTCSEALICAFL